MSTHLFPLILTAAVFLFANLAAAADAQDPAAQIPPAEAGAKDRIEKSPRHGEYVDLPMGEGKTPIRAYVVYPERKEKAPVVIVIHEVYGLTDWIKSVTDQLAADGFIAIAPDFLSGRGADGGGTDSYKSRDEVTQAVRAITPDEAIAITNAARDYATKLPAASGEFATVGFCWGGGKSFEYAVAQPDLSAAVVYYGTSPAAPKEGEASPYDKINAAVLGLYGEDDARVNATVPTAVEQMKKSGKSFTPNTFEGAGHGFLRAQDQRDGANLRAAQKAWPLTIEFIRQHTEAAAKE